MSKFSIGGTLLLLGLLFSSIWYIDHQRKTIEGQLEVISLQKETILILQLSRDIIDSINVERKEFEASLDAHVKKSYTQIRRLLENDEKAANWANTPIPESIIDRMRDTSAVSSTDTRSK